MSERTQKLIDSLDATIASLESERDQIASEILRCRDAREALFVALPATWKEPATMPGVMVYPERPTSLRDRIVSALKDVSPKTAREIAARLEISESAVYGTLRKNRGLFASKGLPQMHGCRGRAPQGWFLVTATNGKDKP